MKKVLFIVICYLLLLTGCTNDSTIRNNDNKGSEIKMSDIKVTISDKTYILKLEDNPTVKEFIHLLPKEFTMSELNGNEKYAYLDSSLPVFSYYPKRIEAGDVMLYGNNCLVIFYQSFNSSYSYTKIGHIDDLPDLGNSDLLVTMEMN